MDFNNRPSRQGLTEMKTQAATQPATPAKPFWEARAQHITGEAEVVVGTIEKAAGNKAGGQHLINEGLASAAAVETHHSGPISPTLEQAEGYAERALGSLEGLKEGAGTDTFRKGTALIKDGSARAKAAASVRPRAAGPTI